MIRTFPIELLLAAGYAVFLVVVAIVLEGLARHSHQRSEQLQVAGFKYHKMPDPIEMVRHNRLEELLLLAVFLAAIGEMGVHLVRAYLADQSSGNGRSLSGVHDG